MSSPLLLLRAAHAGPTVAVSAMSGLLAFRTGLGWFVGMLVVAAVLTGQLTIGWSNDLLDAGRDASVGRNDKPLATGALSPRLVAGATRVALVACVVLSLALGAAAATCHLLLVVGSGWAYNMWLKRTWWSWLPYAVAFGALPGVATLAADPARLPPGWIVVAGALLGTGAHLVNVLPDLSADEVTGVRGFPHRIGARGVQMLAPAVLVLASVVVVLAQRPVPSWAWAMMVATVALAVVAARGRGRTPFRAAIAIALIDVALLTAAR